MALHMFLQYSTMTIVMLLSVERDYKSVRAVRRCPLIAKAWREWKAPDLWGEGRQRRLLVLRI